MPEEVKEEPKDKPETEEKQEAAPETQESQEVPAGTETDDNGSESQETPEQINWKKFREERRRERERAQQLEEERRKKAEEAEALKQAMEALVNKPSKQQDEQYSYYSDEEEETVEQKLERLLEEREKKKEQERLQREQKELPTKLKQAHPDFDRICNEENLDYFEYHYPEVAEAYRYMPDSYDKWDKLYKAVKRFVPSAGDDSNKRRIEKNANKPQSVSTTGQAISSDESPRMLTDERREANWKEMQRIIKGL